MFIYFHFQSKPVVIPPPTLRPQHVYAPVAPLGMLSLGVLSKHKNEVERTFRMPGVEGGGGGGHGGANGGGGAGPGLKDMMQGK